MSGTPTPDRLAQFEQFAADLLAGYDGDAAALERLGARFGDSYNNEQRRVRVRARVDALQRRSAAPTLEDVRLVVARQFRFDTWAALADSLAPAADTSGAGRAGRDTPPFFTIDTERGLIEPRPPLTGTDWETIVAVMQERSLTGIATSAVTDDVLARLSRLDQVRVIRIGGAQQISDDGLRHLARMPQLEVLDLSGGHSPITDRGLEVLRHLPRLTHFSMGWAQQVTDAGMANLASCDQLEEVDLMGTATGDGAIRALAGKPALRRFTTGRLVTDAGLRPLHEFPAFTRWEEGDQSLGLMSFQAGPTSLTIDGPFTDRGLAELAGLDGVFALGLFWHADAFTGGGLAALAALPHLGNLGCYRDRCDDAAMRSIASLPTLRMLVCQGTVASDAGFAALGRSETIEYLWGRECPNLTSPGFAALAAMPALRGLAVSCKQVDDGALATLPRFPALTDLLPMDVSDDGFRHVGRCEQLEHLWCMYCRETGDVATSHIAGLKRLRSYYAGQTKITDRSLEILAGMPSIEKLEFSSTAGITDAGVAALTALPNLREIAVDNAPNVTRAGMAVFPASVRVRF